MIYREVYEMLWEKNPLYTFALDRDVHHFYRDTENLLRYIMVSQYVHVYINMYTYMGIYVYDI